MDLFQLATLARHVHNDEARSALPHAPIRPDDAVRFARSRAAAAGLLHRVADAVAPGSTPTLATARTSVLGGTG